ncbi:hypothetical protein [Bradyrhizobium sp. McL0616]|uniref:hypothetical protein n=1 Tax=Bradyrhizobium sp. McL0616 TaxID=3415674 RepID=UPI003CE7D76E
MYSSGQDLFLVNYSGRPQPVALKMTDHQWISSDDAFWILSGATLVMLNAKSPGKVHQYRLPRSYPAQSDFAVHLGSSGYFVRIGGDGYLLTSLDSESLQEVHPNKYAEPNVDGSIASDNEPVEGIRKINGHLVALDPSLDITLEWRPEVELLKGTPDQAAPFQNIVLTWEVRDYKCTANHELVRFHSALIAPDGKRLAEPVTVDASNYNRFQSIISLPGNEGEYTVEASLTDVFGRRWIYRKNVHIGIYEVDWIKLAKRVGISAAVLNVAVFVILLMGARWSELCFKLLTDPVLRRIGVYFGPTLLYLRPIRLWILQRYFVLAKQEYTDLRSYLPVTLRTASDGRPGKSIMSDGVLGGMAETPLAWVRGESGTGKSELCRVLMRSYFEQGSLYAAWKKFGLVPILVRVRYSSAQPGADWIPESARLSLRRYGLWFSDGEFFQRLLTCGDFLIILDGMNEADVTKHYRTYALSENKARILATSQTPLGEPSVVEYVLPLIRGEAARMLLKLLLGRQEGEKGDTARIAPSLFEDLRSGYDVYLLANVLEAGKKPPSDRTSLYGSILAQAKEFADFDDSVICSIAAEMLVARQRSFGTSDKLTQELIAPLERARIVVTRDGRYEFRHDLMRGYLASRWFTVHCASTEEMLKRISDDKLWALSPGELETLLPFLCDLVTDNAGLEELIGLGMTNPIRFVALLDALQSSASRRGLDVRFAITLESTSTSGSFD